MNWFIFNQLDQNICQRAKSCILSSTYNLMWTTETGPGLCPTWRQTPQIGHCLPNSAQRCSRPLKLSSKPPRRCSSDQGIESFSLQRSVCLAIRLDLSSVLGCIHWKCLWLLWVHPASLGDPAHPPPLVGQFLQIGAVAFDLHCLDVEGFHDHSDHQYVLGSLTTADSWMRHPTQRPEGPRPTCRCLIQTGSPEKYQKNYYYWPDSTKLGLTMTRLLFHFN